jgi:hypothetical protein
LDFDKSLHKFIVLAFAQENPIATLGGFTKVNIVLRIRIPADDLTRVQVDVDEIIEFCVRVFAVTCHFERLLSTPASFPGDSE